MNIQNNFDFINIFEEKLAKYTGFNYACCVDCCTNGILISLELLNHLNIIDKSIIKLGITKYTYMSIPMTLKNNNWNIYLTNNKWKKFYRIQNTNVVDAATDLHENMVRDYNEDDIVCVSFQQKKRLSLGRGGVILTNNQIYYDILKRLVYDGRNSFISDRDEIKNNPNDILCGYHCYMEPDKACQGILKLNQINTLLPYKKHSWREYEDLTKLKFLNKNNET